jgi:hypothetical protein
MAVEVLNEPVVAEAGGAFPASATFSIAEVGSTTAAAVTAAVLASASAGAAAAVTSRGMVAPMAVEVSNEPVAAEAALGSYL